MLYYRASPDRVDAQLTAQRGPLEEDDGECVLKLMKQQRARWAADFRNLNKGRQSSCFCYGRFSFRLLFHACHISFLKQFHVF